MVDVTILQNFGTEYDRDMTIRQNFVIRDEI